MSIQHLIETYGYWALFAGIFVEGETVLIIAGLSAHLGYLKLPWVFLVAGLGAFASDQFYFNLGRWKGLPLLETRPAWQAKVNNVYDLLGRYENLVVIGFRFMSGLRTVTPFAIGMTPISRLRFTLLNLVGITLWVLIYGTLGYLFGNAMEAILEDLKRHEKPVFFSLVLAGFLFWLFTWWRRRRASRAPG